MDYSQSELKDMTKRVFDILFSLIFFVIFLPLLIIISFVIIIFQGGPIIFRQDRLGKDHKKFKIIKFCSMTNESDEKGNLLPDKKRTTKLGDLFREFSVDELPGFFNVLKGDMSVVGPRPLPPQYKDRYSKEQDLRHTVRPGITGWAQINGRNAISWEEKFSFDLWYVENQSIILDLKIIFLTIIQVIKRQGITPDGKDSMEEFLGSKDK
jgi:lipopolysaccharide/colanic/teichoic acid biosynthesis glycosyltransferase